MKYTDLQLAPSKGKKIYIETYGCQMNVVDSETVVSIMAQEGYGYTKELSQADIVLLNTCSIRENAEQRIWGRLKEFKGIKNKRKELIIGIIGCMAERLKDELIEKQEAVDLVVGPDNYRSLPLLIEAVELGSKGINVELEASETYAEISPIRLDANGISAFVAIMRGCNNMCTYCVVPYTRGRERSRNPYTIIEEIKELIADGYKEVTLLGQNVNSFNWKDELGEVSFPKLIEMVAQLSPQLRVRFATSHPKDLSNELIQVVASYPNVCKSIHLPAQSGSSRMLELMNRKYSREWYLERMQAIKNAIPNCSISTDIIAGFCSETEEDHNQTLSLMKEVGYEFAYMFKYSDRPNTKAHRTMVDDISEEVKTARLTQIITLQTELSLKSNKRDIGKTFEVLVEGVSKRSEKELHGRNSQNKVIIFAAPKEVIGSYVNVTVTDCSSATLRGVLAE